MIKINILNNVVFGDDIISNAEISDMCGKHRLCNTMSCKDMATIENNLYIECDNDIVINKTNDKYTNNIDNKINTYDTNNKINTCDQYVSNEIIAGKKRKRCKYDKCIDDKYDYINNRKFKKFKLNTNSQ